MAQRHSGYERKDEYSTPSWVTECVIPYLRNLKDEHGGRRIRTVWEPACGKGAMSAVLGQHFDVISSDINGGIDFLKQNAPQFHFDAVVTNPPWGRYQEYRDIGRKFLEQALKVTAQKRGVVALLFPSEYDCGKTRREYFADCPMFAKKIVLTRRIVWFKRNDGKKEAPSCNHAWFIWDWQHKGAPTLAYEPIEDLANDQLRQVA